MSTSTTVTKKELIDRIAAATGQKRIIVKQTVQTFLEQVIIELGKGHRLEFRDFGVFEIKQRAPRMAQNPKTLARVEVPAKRTVKFKVGRLMKECLENPEAALAEIAAALAADAQADEEEAAPAPAQRNGRAGRHNGRNGHA